MSQSSRGRSGVLPINPSIMKKTAAGKQDLKSAPKSPAPRLRLLVRRLPPGLTETEFWTCMGAEWKVGGGKVEWVAYKEGKISRDPSKPSRPARAYLKVRDPVFVDILSAKVKQTTFQDAKTSTKDSCLLGPPSLEFAPFNKVPGGRVRHDGRQGTIDQDQEFVDFLQSLTEPISKPLANGLETGEGKTAITTTPLIQYIKEKKAAKAKEAAAAKSAKAKEAKAAKTEKKPAVVVKKGATTPAEKEKLAKATQETVNAINKSVAAMQKKPNAPKGDSKAGTGKETPPATPPAKRERERGTATAANRILQRDLGLAPKEPRSKRASQTPIAPKTDEQPVPAESESATPPSVNAPPAPSTLPAGPKNPRTSANNTAKNVQQQQRPTRPLLQPSNGAKSAFLKHANPSQGVTEDLLRTAFEAYGSLTRCEIDRKKGFGYIDFTETESLRKAMQASPVKVGNGQVVVLENKVRPTGSTKGSAPASPALRSTQPASDIKDTTSTTSAERKDKLSANPNNNNQLQQTTSNQNKPPQSSTPTPAPTSGPKAATSTSPISQPAPQQPSSTPRNVPACSANTNRANHPNAPVRGNYAGAGPRGGRGNYRGARGNMPFRHRGGRPGGGAAATPGTTVEHSTNATTTTSTTADASGGGNGSLSAGAAPAAESSGS